MPARARPTIELAGGNAKVVIEQAMASINQTTPERFKAAQTMLEKAIAADPGNVDLAAALAAHLLRGIQMTWYNRADVAETQRAAQSMLEQALRAKPTYIPVLEAYCRLLDATNQFIESLVACGRVLTFDPWDGLAIYNLGLGQLRLGRFETRWRRSSRPNNSIRRARRAGPGCWEQG